MRQDPSPSRWPRPPPPAHPPPPSPPTLSPPDAPPIFTAPAELNVSVPALNVPPPRLTEVPLNAPRPVTVPLAAPASTSAPAAPLAPHSFPPRRSPDLHRARRVERQRARVERAPAQTHRGATECAKTRHRPAGRARLHQRTRRPPRPPLFPPPTLPRSSPRPQS